MAEHFFALGRDDQREVLEQVRARIDRPTHLLEKDVWVVWALGGKVRQYSLALPAGAIRYADVLP